MLKRFIKISYSVFAGLVGLIMLLYFLVNTHMIQNYLGNRLTGYLNEKYQVRISIGEISYDGWSFLSLRHVFMGDQKSDTLFYVGRLQVNLVGIKLDSSHIQLRDLVLDEPLAKFTTYSDNTYSLDLLDKFSSGDTAQSAAGLPFRLEIRNLEVMDGRFQMRDFTRPFSDNGFDHNNIDFFNGNFRSQYFSLVDDSMSFDLRNLSAKERCGAEVIQMKAQMTICPSTIAANNLDLVTPNSHVKNHFSMNTRNWSDYDEDFEGRVYLKWRLRESKIDIRDLAYFIPALDSFQYQFNLSCDAGGPLKDLSLKQVNIEMGKETHFLGQLTITGLPEIEETFLDIKVNQAATSGSDLEKLVGSKLPKEVWDLGHISYAGRFTGFYNDFVGYGILETPFGSAKTDLNLKFVSAVPAYSGFIKINYFQLGKYLNRSDFGNIDLEGGIKGEGFELKSLNADFNGSVAKIGVSGYTYHNLNLVGSVRKKEMNLTMEIADSNLIFQAQVVAGLGGDYTHFMLKGNLDDARLKALGLHKEAVRVTAKLDVDYYFRNLNDHHGYLAIEDFKYEKAGQTYHINNVRLESANGQEENLTIQSDFLKGQIKGQFDMEELYGQIRYWCLSLGKDYFNEHAVPDHTQQFEFQFTVTNTAAISPLLFPEISIIGLEVNGKVNNKDQSFLAVGHVNSLQRNEWHLNQTTFRVQEKGRREAEVLVGIRNLFQNDTLLIGDFAMKAKLEVNHWNLEYHVLDSQSLVQLHFDHKLHFVSNRILVEMAPSWIQSGYSRWELDTGQHMEFNNQQIIFNKMELVNAQQSIQLNGYYHYNGQEKNISAQINNLDLNTLNQYKRDLQTTVNGKVNGYLVYKNRGSRDVVIGEVKANNVSFDRDTFGDFECSLGYREGDENLLIDFRSMNSKINDLHGSGTYSVAKRYLDLDIGFKDMRINSFQPFVKDYIHLFGGSAQMSAKLNGTPGNLKLNGQVDITDADFRVDYLQTRYILKKSTLVLESNEIRILPCDLLDENRQIAQISGKIAHKGFTDFSYELKAKEFKSFQLLKTQSRDNELFYGTAYGRGSFSMKGDLQSLTIQLDLVTEKGTKVTINPFGASAETGESYIRFIDYDTVQLVERKTKKNIDFRMEVKMAILATTDAEIQVIFDAKSDDRIRARGNSNMRMEYLPNGEFKMYGDYVLSEGEYRFSAMNVVAKKFDLRRGSSIEWSGDPLAGIMNISGIYRLKTAISPIVNMSNASDPNVRLPVECLINIRGIVERPEISFDLNFPDLQNVVGGTTATELNAVVANFRREPEMMNQQILFLLISGGFVPITNSNSASNTGIGNQTVSDLISRQAAGLIGKAIPNIDVSVDLLNASDPTKSRTLLLSASRKFLDNRLEVQTSYAIDQTQTNFAATYNLKKNEGTKLKVFNKSGFDALYNRNVITSGTGLYYRKEFNNLEEFFKKRVVN